MRTILLLLSLLTITLLYSCFPEDEKIEKHKSGNVQNFEAGMTESYKNQIFFNFATNKMISSVEKSEWDIAFESSAEGWHILLNTAKFMKAAVSTQTQLSDAFDTTGLKWNFDVSNGNLDSTAIGTWLDTNSGFSFNKVYYIDLGIDENGNNYGYRKLLIETVDTFSFTIKYSNQDGSNNKTELIQKNKRTNFTFYSLIHHKTVDVEPDFNVWDILFTTYTTTLFDDNGTATPYLVLGVLLNRKGVEAAFSDSISFEKMTYDKAVTLKFSSQIDFIGYEWKKYDFKNGNYSVLSSRTYVIRDIYGYLYKMRFISFYNNSGEKGYPQIESKCL